MTTSTPAASRAATLPADIRALLESCQRWHNGSDWRHDVRIERRLAWQGHGEAIASALAAQPASPAPLTDERAAFEAWYGGELGFTERKAEREFAKNPDGSYYWDDYDPVWAIWKEAAAEFSSIEKHETERDAHQHYDWEARLRAAAIRHVAALASPQVAPASEIVYQKRHASPWTAIDEWSAWQECSAEMAKFWRENPQDKQWKHEVRELRVAAPVQVAPTPSLAPVLTDKQLDAIFDDHGCDVIAAMRAVLALPGIPAKAPVAPQDDARVREIQLKARRTALEEAAAECDRLTWAVDIAGKRYKRPASADYCASIIRQMAAEPTQGEQA